MIMKTDIEIARECKMLPIEQVAEKIGVPQEQLEHYGKYIAKVPCTLTDEEKVAKAKLILVTAITPTKAGNGKTTVSVGLSMGLNKLGKNACCTLREPSLGPCFGMKGGAAGGGYSQVVPMEKINLHFTGDFHAVTSANNMIAALLDNYIYQHQEEVKIKKVLWKRVLDVNDRALRHVTTGQGAKTDGVVLETGFDITPASEIMAILCLATSMEDLRRRIDNILLAILEDGSPLYVKDLKIGGSIVALLLDAVSPNLVQTTENTPAFVHGGPFANIAHGCNTILATKLSMSFCDYVVTEAGFGADLGAEKFYDIKCRKAGLKPALTVLIATLPALRLHGGAEDQNQPDKEAVGRGIANLERHIENIQNFGQKVVVTLNSFAKDTAEEVELVAQACERMGVRFVINKVFTDGGNGALDLAKAVVEEAADKPELNFCYADTDDIKTKIEKVCKQVYRAEKVSYSEAAEAMISEAERLGYANLPVCIAKTQYSFSADAKALGAPVGFEIVIRDLVINGGSEMLVAIAGSIIRMPGLGKSPQAERIDVVNGLIEGLN